MSSSALCQWHGSLQKGPCFVVNTGHPPRRCSTQCKAWPRWLQNVKQAVDSLIGAEDEPVLEVGPAPRPQRTAGLTAGTRPARSSRPPQVQAITHVEVADDLLVLLDVKRRRLVYVVCADGPTDTEKIVNLVQLSGSKLVWIVSEVAKEHAGLAQALMSAVPCSAWEINVSENSFHPAQLAMLHAQAAPSPSDGFTMPLQRMLKKQDKADTPMGRMRRASEDNLAFGHMRELRSRGRRPRLGIKKRYSHMKALMMQPSMAVLTDGIMVARNRDVEVVWHNLTDFRLGPRLGRGGRVLGFLTPFPPQVSESLSDKDFVGSEVEQVWHTSSGQSASPSSESLTAAPASWADWSQGSEDEEESQPRVKPPSEEGERRQTPGESARMPTPDPRVPYMSEWTDVQRELYMAVLQDPFGAGAGRKPSDGAAGVVAAEWQDAAAGDAAGVYAGLLGTNEQQGSGHQRGRSGSSERGQQQQSGDESGGEECNTADPDNTCSREEFAEKLTAYSAKEDLSDDELNELMLNHRELRELGLVPDSVSSGTLTVTTNSDGQGIIIQHDAQGSREGTGSSGEYEDDGQGEGVLASKDDGDGASTSGRGWQGAFAGIGNPVEALGGFNCQLQMSDDPNDMSILIRVNDGSAAGGDTGRGKFGTSDRTFLERCYKEDSNYDGQMKSLEEHWQSRLREWGLDTVGHEPKDSTATPTNGQPTVPKPERHNQQQPEANRHSLSESAKANILSDTPHGSVSDSMLDDALGPGVPGSQPEARTSTQPTAGSEQAEASSSAEGRASTSRRLAGKAKGRSHTVSKVVRASGERSKVPKAQDATSLARDLLGRDVSLQEAEELAAALYQAASLFESPEVQTAEAVSLAAAAAAAAQARLVASEPPPAAPQSPLAGGTQHQPQRPQAASSDSHLQALAPTGGDDSISGSGSASSTASGVAGRPAGGPVAGTSDTDTAGGAASAEEDYTAGTSAAVGEARVTIDDLVSAVRDKMNAAFGLAKAASASKKGAQGGGNGGKREIPYAYRSRSSDSSRAGARALPGTHARSQKVRTVSKLRHVVKGWTSLETQQPPASSERPSQRRPWGTAWAAAAPTQAPAKQGVSYMQAARTVARLMELLHKPCDGTTSFAQQDVIVVLPARPSPGSSSASGPQEEAVVNLLMTDDGVIEYGSDIMSVIKALAGGSLDGDEGDEGDVPLSVVAKEVAATWNSWEQELMAPGVKAVGMPASRYLAK